MLEQLINIKNSQKFLTDEEIALVWQEYENIFGPFIGSKTCQDCIRTALKKTIVHLMEQENGK